VIVPRKIIIDVDPGIGDALAVALALLDPELDVVAVTATAGCVSARDATRNLQGIVEQIDPPKWPRLGAAAGYQTNQNVSADLGELALLNGPKGLGDWEFPVAELHHRHDSTKLITDLVKAEPNTITILTLGPLTNIAAACERAPEFLSQVQGLVCLGGSIAVGGDVTAAAEMNMYLDPDAAHTVLRSPATKTLIPLDVSRRVVMTFEHFNRFPSAESSRIAAILQRLLPYSFRAHHQYLGLEGMPLREVAALASITRPSLFRTEPMAVDVEVNGTLTRGMTVFDRRGIPRWQSNIEVVTEVDTQGVLDYMTEIISRAS
jgi:inosine-uridine nucleoside N-ribohydrolase